MTGKEVLNYRIESLIGKGGMGSVYLASNKHINQKVAIKVLHENLIQSDFVRQKFMKEAQTLLTLDNPNIVKFINFYENEDGVFLIMEYIDGITLDDFINNKNGLIVESRIYNLFNQILDAFAYAHDKGVIHRDIKPANIILTSDNDGNFMVKILDFGIARILSESNDDEKGLIIGTPLYMSPEQMTGENPDKRSDIYSLGVLLHQMMTGHAPYSSTTLSEMELQRKIVEEPLPRMKEYYQHISDRLQRVVDKATAKDPAARYPNCTAFRKDFNPKPPAPLWLKVAGAAVVALLLGCGWWFWDYNYHTKIYYYKDYAEQWGVPKGIGKTDFRHRDKTYRFEYRKGKLRKLTLINSKGNVVTEDNESERFDRPLNADFEYQENDIAYVLYKNHNGKALFRKRYNKKDGKINMFVFEYNDDNGTDKRLPNDLTGYVRLEDETAERGQISRFALDFDKNGYVTALHYRNREGESVSDKERIYGKRYERDEKGRVVTEYLLAGNDSVKATSWGLGMKKFVYDKDNLVTVYYLSPDGSPSCDDRDGVVIYEMEYDEYGNLIYAWHKSSENELMLPKKHGVAGLKQVFDKNGEKIQYFIMGTDKQPMYGTGAGTFGLQYEYDENGYAKKLTCIDENGNPMISGNGNTYTLRKNDSKGNMLEERYYDIDSQPFEIQNGYFRMVAEFDSCGNQTSLFFYDVNDVLCLNAYGYAGERQTFNDRNMLTAYTHYGVDSLPCEVKGVVTTKYEYNPLGNETKRSFYAADGKTLVSDNDGVAGWESKYDEYGNLTEHAFFDANGMRTAGNMGYASRHDTYNAYGYLEERKFLDSKGRLSNNHFVARYKYDSRGNISEKYRYDENMRLVGRMAYQYDSRDNQTEIAYYDQNNNPTLGMEGAFRIVSEFDSRNQEIEERYYNTANRLFAPKADNYAIVRYKYDNRGNNVEAAFFNESEKSVCKKEGYAMHKSEYDDMGRIIRQTFYDENGQPTKPSIYVPEGLAGYDKWGNMNYIAAADGNGNLINYPQTRWSVRRTVYDIKRNMLEEALYDYNDNPAVDENNAHKRTCNYDRLDRLIEERFYASPDELRKEPFAIRRYKYDEQGRLIETTHFNDSDKAVDVNNIAHRLVYSYDEQGGKSMKRYKVNGSLESTQKWNEQTETWESENKTQASWRTSIQAFSDDCPIQVSNQLEVTSVTLKSSGCDIVLRYKEVSKYNISDAEQEALIDEVKAFAARLKQETEMPRNTRVVVIVTDKAQRELFRITY